MIAVYVEGLNAQLLVLQNLHFRNIKCTFRLTICFLLIFSLSSVSFLYSLPQGAIRCLAARAIREVIRSLPEAYKDDIKLIVNGLIETQGDSLKEVSR